MKIVDLYNVLKEVCDKGNGDCELEFWIKLDDGVSALAYVDSIGQYSVVPDMTITVSPTGAEGKIYTSDIPDREQFMFRSKYETILQLVSNLNNEIQAVVNNDKSGDLKDE